MDANGFFVLMCVSVMTDSIANSRLDAFLKHRARNGSTMQGKKTNLDKVKKSRYATAFIFRFYFVVSCRAMYDSCRALIYSYQKYKN